MLKFTKMHGLGNDYVYVDCFVQHLDGVDLPALARAMSDRHRGVGSDGLILICPPLPGVAADLRMEMYNADGSRAEMCGNGIRCVAKYAVEHGLVGECVDGVREMRIETDRGVLTVEALLSAGDVADPSGARTFSRDPRRPRGADATREATEEGARGVPRRPRGADATASLYWESCVESVRVNMGPPILEPTHIPVAIAGRRCIRLPVEIEGRILLATCVSMGNPHAVIFVDELDAVDLARVGPQVERHPLFPRRVNVHIAAIQSPQEASVITWERGAGLTQACGTGACAVLVAGVLEGRMERRATLHLPGGALMIEWADSADGVSGDVFMTGPAVEVFSGEWLT